MQNGQSPQSHLNSNLSDDTILIKFLALEKQREPIFSTLGNLTVLSEVQFSNTFSPNCIAPERSISTSDEQLQNASHLISSIF